MKRGNSKGEVETISAKTLFGTVLKKGEGQHGSFHIYKTSDYTDDAIRFRCDMGEDGSFEVSKEEGEDEWDTKYNDWIWVKGTIYKYHSCSTTYAGYPYLPIDKAYDLLITPKQQ